ncbi:hypothetical protein ABEB36_011957 [Hypothenemus hampei]|uniref:Uncharacterized protein n=1 Tax=Hypothenemus hampei TaxID=57062 RepID=A0ABD1E9L0_HYPHA
MNCFTEKVKLDVFNEKTTYLNDYKQYCDVQQETVRTQHIREEPKVPSPPERRRIEDHETFCKWKDDVYIPFNLLIDPKPIIQTDPRNPFKKLDSLPDDAKIEAQKKRPRIYLAPACSIDDVPDVEMRKLLCDYMYTTEWRKAEVEGASGFKPNTPDIATIETKDCVLENGLHRPLKETVIQESKECNEKQRKNSSDPTKNTCTHKDPPVLCGASEDPLKNLVPEPIKKEISDAITQNRLRLAHDLTSPSYTGYKPRFAYGVTIVKNSLPPTHPMLSTYQAVTSRYVQDLK